MADEKFKRKAIRRARLMQWTTKNFKFLFTSSTHKSERKVIFLDTEYGKVRTLWYGLNNKEKLPLYIDLHGGGFIFGSSEMDEAMNVEIQQKVGCKIVSIDYPKAPNHPYPAAVNQIYTAIEYIVNHANEFGVDVMKMAIGGHSAGGNLATVTCMKASETNDFRFVCQILDYPPLDIATNPYEKPQPKGCIPPGTAEMFNACYVDPARAKEKYASPVFADVDDLKSLPPALVIVAGQDSLHDEGLKYAQMLASAGVAVETKDYPNALHGFTLKPSDDTSDAISTMIQFLKKYMCIGEENV